MKAKRTALGLVLVAGIAACGDSTAPLLPTGPSYEGGHTLGGGTRETDTGTTSAPMAGDSVGRGHTLGSGG